MVEKFLEVYDIFSVFKCSDEERLALICGKFESDWFILLLACAIFCSFWKTIEN